MSAYLQTNESGVVIAWTSVETPGSISVELLPNESPGDYMGRVWDGAAFVQPEAEPMPAPRACTPAQGLVALFVLKAITEDDIKAAVSKIPDPAARYTASIAMSRSTEWRLDSNAMQAMAMLLQLTESDLDELFTFAATVNV